MVEVSNKHKSITVAVSSKNGNTVVAASSDTSQYWANQSHTFANQSKDSVQEAKHYAELANSYIEGFENVVTNNTNNIIETGNDCINQLNTTKEEAVDNITTVKSESIASVEAKSNEVLSTVNTGIADINNAKTTAVNAVNTSKNEALNAINQTGVNNLANKDLSNLSAKGEQVITDLNKVNNPYFFGMYIFSEFQPKNLSWLKSNAQWNSGAGYVDFNNWVVENANNGVENFKLSTDSYTDYDFVANITDNTFRLPVKVQQKFYNETAPVAGNGMTLGIVGAHRDGLDVINGLCSVDAGTYSEEGIYLTTTHGVPVGTTCETYRTTNNNSCETVGLTTDENNSGIIAKLGSAENTNLSLYFYVGETVRDASLINVAEIASVIADKVDAQQASAASMPSNKKVTIELGASSSNYTAPANGWFQASIKSKGTTKNTYIGLRNTTSGFHARYANYHNSTSVENTLICNCPARKGETVNIYYDVAATISSQSLEFIYAEGDK